MQMKQMGDGPNPHPHALTDQSPPTPIEIFFSALFRSVEIGETAFRWGIFPAIVYVATRNPNLKLNIFTFIPLFP